MAVTDQKISFGTLTYYFLPLAFQAISQSLSYPLVAIVASQAEGGVLNVGGLVAGNQVMVIISMLGAGLITTGMMYVKDKQSLSVFRQLSDTLAVVVTILQILLLLPPIAHFVFWKLLHLEPLVESAAYHVIMVGIPMQYCFFLRNQYIVVLYNKKETLKASIPSILRVVFTAILAKIFTEYNFVGAGWAIICLMIPVALEAAIFRYLALPFIKEMPNAVVEVPKKIELLMFTLPISISSLLIIFSAFLMTAYITRTPNGNQMYAVYALVLGLVSPMSFAATKIQAIVLLFIEELKSKKILISYAIVAGLVLGVIPLLFIIPYIGEKYYVGLQNLPREQMHLAVKTSFALLLVPLAVALRAYVEGLVAFSRKTTMLLAGQGLYLASIAIIGFFALNLGLPGNLIGGVGLIFANIISAAVMYSSLHLEKYREGQHSLPTKTSVGPMDPT